MTQGQRILEFLQSGKRLSRLNAWETLGVLEAPARISELRAAGHRIYTEMKQVRNRYGETVRVAEWSM